MRIQTVTLLFSDVVGSTELSTRLGDDRGHEVRREYLAALRHAVQSHAGTEIKSLGDGLMAAFFSAGDSVAAAISMQRSILALGRRHAGLGLALRVGVSVGDATGEDGDWFGTPVVEAARLCTSAQPGQILVSELVPAMMRFPDSPRFEPIGPVRLKGLPAPVPVWSVAWELGAGYRPALPQALDTSRLFVFVGRAGATQVLDEAWHNAFEGHSRLQLIAGEPGVGKTRLVAELGERVHEAGAIVLYGRCDEEFGVPYQPFVEAARRFVASCPVEELATLVGDNAADLSRMLPEIADRLEGVQPADRDETEVGRQRLFQAFNDFLTTMSLSAPVLLILDDLQWAAKPTLLLLRYLVRYDPLRRLLIVGTYRDTDLDRTHPLASMLADLRRDKRVQRLELSGLSGEEVDQFVETAAGHALDTSIAQVAKAIYVETEGNPFFVGQLLRHLTESGALVKTDGVWKPSRPLSDLGIPEGVRELIGRRLSRLSPSNNDVLGAASVIGRDFDTALLVAVSGAGEDEVLDALEAAERARLIALEPGRVDRYRFKHALVRSTLYDELPTTRRLRLHRRVGLELEARGAAGDEGGLVELAHHFREVAALGEIDRAVRYGRLAGDRARARLAFEEAASQYEGALGALALLDEPDRISEAELRVALAGALREAGDTRYRSVAFEVAAEARRAGDARLLAKAALVLGASLGTVALPLDGRKVRLLEEALEMLSVSERPLRALLLAMLAAELLWDPDQEERRRRLVGEALSVTRELDNRPVLVRVLIAAHQADRRQDDLDSRLQVASELVREADELGEPELAFFSRMLRFGDLIEHGEVVAAGVDLRRARDLAGMLLVPQPAAWIAYVEAGQALLAGRFGDADQAETAAAETAVRAGTDQGAITSMSRSLRWVLHWETGQLADALTIARAAAADLPAVAYWHAVVAMLASEAGLLDEARLAYAAATARGALPHDPLWLAGSYALAWAAANLGDGPEMDRLSVLLDGRQGQVAWNGVVAIGPVDLALARLRTAQGDPEEGRRLLAGAASTAARMQAAAWIDRLSTPAGTAVPGVTG